MVLANPNQLRAEKMREMELPVIDLLGQRSEVSKLIVKACEEYGFFKLINHGVGEDVIKILEDESLGFFGKPAPEKQLAGPPNPYGYGSKTIGLNGDNGEVEYILMNPRSISQSSTTTAKTNPKNFSCAVSCYVEAVRKVACEILELMAEGLGVQDRSAFSRLIRDVHSSDSLLRFNHYPPHPTSPSFSHQHHTNARTNTSTSTNRIGFGEHSDPQILTLLRSNGVPGLQISLQDAVWIPVTPDPTAFFVNVGDMLQVMTNGRLLSVRHRAVANSNQARMSIAYFCAPALHENICTPLELMSLERPPIYRAFTWAEYKKTTYSMRLGDSRLNLFKWKPEEENKD